MRAYGRYVATKFRRFDNVLWVQGGDFNPPRVERALVAAVGEGIRSVHPGLQTFHGSRGTSALGYWQPRPRWLSLNTIYTHAYDVVAHARAEHRRSRLPFFLLEAKYETRRFGEDRTAAGLPGDPCRWQRIVCGELACLVVCARLGRGSRQSGCDGDGIPRAALPLSRVVEASSGCGTRADHTGHRNTTESSGRGICPRYGSIAVVYTPTPRLLTLDLTQINGQRVSARWYDPAAGRYHRVDGSPFRTAGRRTLRAPGLNEDGDGILILQARP